MDVLYEWHGFMNDSPIVQILELEDTPTFKLGLTNGHSMYACKSHIRASVI